MTRARIAAMAWSRRHDPGARAAIWAGMIVLGVCYAWAYLHYPERPGVRPGFPNGWWDWFDQGQTLRSTMALAHGDLTPSRHWYPLGYAILGAPFIWLSQAHPYFLVDLACLLVAFLAFCRVARRFGVPAGWGAGIFLATCLVDRRLFDQWVIPWNTTPLGALMWLLLALTIDGAPRTPRRGLAIGAVAGCVPLVRPSDAALVAACLGTMLVIDVLVDGLVIDGLRQRWTGAAGRAWLRIAAWMVLGAAIPVLPYAALHLAIYGPHASAYMRHSADIGFSSFDLAWKAYVVLVDPRPWFHDGDGLLRHCPWLALALAGAIPALRHGRPAAILLATLVAHATLYLAYVDMLPTGMWRHLTVHYWVWALPGYALLAFDLLKLLARGGAARPAAAASIAVTAVLLCVHLDPIEVGRGTPAKLLRFEGVAARFDDVYNAEFELRDARGPLPDITAARAYPTPGGLDILALRRPFGADVAWASTGTLRVTPPGALSSVPPTRWGIAASLGWPCWLPHAACTVSPAAR